MNGGTEDVGVEWGSATAGRPAARKDDSSRDNGKATAKATATTEVFASLKMTLWLVSMGLRNSVSCRVGADAVAFGD